jgi:hypothetical protein
MEKLGYGRNQELKVKVAPRDFNAFRDPAVILVGQLDSIYFDAELDIGEPPDNRRAKRGCIRKASIARLNAAG